MEKCFRNHPPAEGERGTEERKKERMAVEQAGIRCDFSGSQLARDPKTGNFLDVAARVREIYSTNRFMMDFMYINIDEIKCGNCTVSLKIDPERHANHRRVVHGGVLTALADAVLGVTGASVGEVVVTASFSMNFIRNIRMGETARMVSHVKHHGRTTMVIEGEMYDEENRLMATMLATMMNVDKFEGIPAKW